MENEVPEDLQIYLEETFMHFQLVPLHMHKRNNAERAVRKFKNQFMASQCTVDPYLNFY